MARHVPGDAELADGTKDGRLQTRYQIYKVYIELGGRINILVAKTDQLLCCVGRIKGLRGDSGWVWRQARRQSRMKAAPPQIAPYLHSPKDIPKELQQIKHFNQGHHISQKRKSIIPDNWDAEAIVKAINEEDAAPVSCHHSPPHSLSSLQTPHPSAPAPDQAHAGQRGRIH